MVSGHNFFPMKNTIDLSNLFRFASPRIIFAILPVLSVFGGAHAIRAADITDAEIRDVINRVAHHQIHPLKDGDYLAVNGPNAAQQAAAAAPPDGIAWSYPWGVTLFGMLRSIDETGDKDVAKFVLDHNAICAREYNW